MRSLSDWAFTAIRLIISPTFVFLRLDADKRRLYTRVFFSFLLNHFVVLCIVYILYFFILFYLFVDKVHQRSANAHANDVHAVEVVLERETLEQRADEQHDRVEYAHLVVLILVLDKIDQIAFKFTETTRMKCVIRRGDEQVSVNAITRG